MTTEDIAILKQCKHGTKIRILDLPKKYNTDWWWKSAGIEYFNVLMENTVTISRAHLAGIERPYYSINRGLSCNVNMPDGSWMDIYNAKVELVK